jgi:hypothetical protein
VDVKEGNGVFSIEEGTHFREKFFGEGQEGFRWVDRDDGF